jgi:hypothetical protein
MADLSSSGLELAARMRPNTLLEPTQGSAVSIITAWPWVISMTEIYGFLRSFIGRSFEARLLTFCLTGCKV